MEKPGERIGILLINSCGNEKERFLDVRSKDEEKVSLDEIYYKIFIRIKQKKPSTPVDENWHIRTYSSKENERIH